METKILSIAELKNKAKVQLKGNWNKLALITLVYLVITMIINGAPNILGDTAGVFSSLASFILTGPLSLGSTILFLNFVKSEPYAMETLFSGFKRFVPAFLLVLLTVIFIILWSLLLIIPGIIVGLSYSMAIFILAENPEISPMDALKESKRIMKGYKWKYFLFSLSFIGWAFLCIFTLGIGLLWLIPYIETSTVNFYLNIKEAQQ